MKPPLELAVELVTASGAVTRWDANARDAGSIPQGITFNTKRGDGFSDGPQITLNRRIDRDYADINLYDDVRLIGADGSVAYEGYVAANPRSFDGGHTVSIRVAGPMTLAQQQPFSEIYIDRDMSRWATPSNARLVGIIQSLGRGTDAFTLNQATDPSGSHALTFTATYPWSGTQDCEAWYDAGRDSRVARIWCSNVAQVAGTKFVVTNSSPNLLNAWTSSDDVTSAISGTTGLAGGAGFDLTPTPYRYAYLELVNAGSTGGGPASGDTLGVALENVAIVGNHGLTLHSSTTVGPGGLYVSDMISDIARRFTPLNPSGVQQTTYPVDHTVFAQSQPYDAWLALNKFHLWELNVWENRTLFYYPADTTTYDWQVRLDDPGVTVDLPGESTEQLANGIVVSYLDISTGLTQVLTPNDSAVLEDPNPLNPATLHGLQVWTTVDLSSEPFSASDAEQIGAAKLAEYNQVKAAGTITFLGHIRDRAGNWQPGWKVRASDTIAIIDHPDDRPRLIGETSWDHDNLQGTIAVDNTLNRMDAYLDRLSGALAASNVGSFPA